MDQATHEHVVHPSGFPLAPDALTLESGPLVIQPIQGNGMDGTPLHLKNLLRRVRVRLAEGAVRSREVRRVELRHAFLRGERTKAMSRVMDEFLSRGMQRQQEQGHEKMPRTIEDLQDVRTGAVTETVNARAGKGLALNVYGHSVYGHRRNATCPPALSSRHGPSPLVR